MSEQEQGTHWINNEVLTPQERILYLEREIELSLEQGELNARKKIFKKIMKHHKV
jgi:hypothetical protein